MNTTTTTTPHSFDFEDELFFGLPLTTHRHKELGEQLDGNYFQYEALIAGIAIFFFRSTWTVPNEFSALKWFFAAVLGFLAYSKKSYELITAVELFSYAVPLVLQSQVIRTYYNRNNATVIPEKVLRLLLIAMSGLLSVGISSSVASGAAYQLLQTITPNYFIGILHSLLPVDEVTAAYNIMAKFQPNGILRQQVDHLLFVTFHIQFGIGHLGIEFLTKEQHRRNELVMMDTSKADKEQMKKNGTINPNNSDAAKLEKAHQFQRGAAPFIFLTAVPYMIQIIFYGNLNKFAFSCLQHDMHRSIRLNQLFDQDNHMLAMALESPTSPEAYADSMDVVVTTTYEMFNRKLFSLPKVILLPAVISRTPQMMAQIFPIIFVTDYIKGQMINYMTTRVEDLQKEIQLLTAVRSKVESFDLKNAELLQRSGGPQSRQFTQKRWEMLSVQIQAKSVVSDLIQRTKGFFSWIQRNFVFAVLVDCALANLIAIGKIVSAEIFVFSRAIEDAVDMVLMKSRSEAELARMMTEIEKLEELADIWQRAHKQDNLLPCKLADKEQDGITLRHVHYSRGTAVVHAEHVDIEPGIYALTGANGSGKSTLFRVLMSCDTNEKPIDCPQSIIFSSPSVSLVEKDDMIDDAKCEADAKAAAKAAAEAASDSDDYEAPVCVETTDGECRVLEEEKAAIVPIPKLSITMPSSQIVEISQTFYWPLYTKPIDWIYQEHISDTLDDAEFQRRLRKIAEELQAMSFFQGKQAAAIGEEGSEASTEQEDDDGIATVMEQLQEEKEDWFGDLSGGQKSKVELVRKVFMQERCPNVVLIDETFAPLDPTSKILVMSKLKEFCKGSIIIVIYHADIGHGQETDDGIVECVPSSAFFDHNIHLENQVIHLRPVC